MLMATETISVDVLQDFQPALATGASGSEIVEE